MNEIHRSKTYQVPKKTHPWRQYRNRVTIEVEIEAKDIISLKDYLQGIIDNWDKMEVTVFGNLGDRTYTLSNLPQKKAAAYIVGIIKRNYIDG